MQRLTRHHKFMMFVLFLTVLIFITTLIRQGYVGRDESADVAEAGRPNRASARETKAETGRPSATIEYSTVFAGQTMQVDGRAFHECTFRDCVLIYSGGKPPSLVGCTLEDVSWKFTGAAGNTICFLSLLHDDMYRGGHGPMERGFEWLRQLSNPNGGDAQTAQGEDEDQLSAEGGPNVEQ